MESWKNGGVVVSKPVEYPVCPDCGNSSEYLHQEVVDDAVCPIVITSCPACGWIQGVELFNRQQKLG